jgi:cytoskeletal protein CcmA (bactofilin family)
MSISHQRHRRAYILLVVLAFTALASALGMSFLEANSTVMPEAVNYQGMVRAEALASSGVALASHLLLYPPTNLSLTQYYTGASGVTLDSSGDYFDVSVVRSDAWSPAQTDLNLYRIIATGVAKDPGGAIRAKRSATAEIQAPPIGKWQFTQGFISSGLALVVPTRATITGDLHANGNISGTGSCTGKVSATGTATWLGGGPPTSIVSLAPSIARPLISPYQASTYTIRGRTYTPYTTYSSNQITPSDASTLNAIDMSASNPGRIIIAPTGDLTIRQNVQLTGTLVVNGNLRIDDSGSHQVTAVSGFPALVVTGDVQIRSATSTTTINGSVICSGMLDSQLNASVSVTVNGTCFFDSGMDAPRSTCTYLFNWDANRSVFWDIQNVPPAPQPMTVLNWKEN